MEQQKQQLTKEEPTFLHIYLEDLREQYNTGMDGNNNKLSGHQLKMIEGFVDRQSPNESNDEVITLKIDKYIKLLEKETKGVGHFVDSSLGFAGNNLIDATKDLMINETTTITNFKWFVKKLQEHITKLNKQVELLEQGEVLEETISENTVDGIEIDKARTDVDFIRKYIKTHQEFTIPELMIVLKRKANQITIALNKLKKLEEVDKTEGRKDSAYIWINIQK